MTTTRRQHLRRSATFPKYPSPPPRANPTSCYCTHHATASGYADANPIPTLTPLTPARSAVVISSSTLFPRTPPEPLPGSSAGTARPEANGTKRNKVEHIKTRDLRITLPTLSVRPAQQRQRAGWAGTITLLWPRSPEANETKWTHLDPPPRIGSRRIRGKRRPASRHPPLNARVHFAPNEDKRDRSAT